MPIVQGGSGYTIPVEFFTDKGRLDLTGATIVANVNDGERIFTKTCEITDAQKGICQFKLTSSDLLRSGTYYYQATATYSNGDKFPTDMKKFDVGVKIPEPDGQTGSITVAVDGGEF